MKKYIMGGIIGVGLMISGIALASGIGMVEADNLSVEGGTVTKIYDKAPNVICYIFQRGDFGSTYSASSKEGSVGISCLKNN